MVYHFGDFELEKDGRELRRREATSGLSRVDAPPKVLALLHCLVRAAPRVVTRGELLDEVWDGQVVSTSALNTVVKSLRRSLADDDHQIIRTTHGIGYSFALPVERRGSSGASFLGEVRRRVFVGREAELARLVSWFEEPSRPAGDARIFWVHGVGGIGKTTLIHQLEARAFARAVPVVTVSCTHLRPSPDALIDAIATNLGVAPASALPASLATFPAGLLVLDGYEAISGIDDWLRERFVQRLPSGWRLVISGRRPPSVRWRADPTWTYAVELLLEPLSSDEADALLERRGVSAPEREAILSFAGGHPLTLVLATESLRCAGRSSGSLPSANESLTAALVEAFVNDVPSKRHREALDCLAVAGVVDEPLLASMLGDDAAVTECFHWLSTLGMVERHPAGLVLHDLAKGALVRNLTWRNLERLGCLVERAYTKLFADLEVATSSERRHRLVASLWRIFDVHPVLSPFMSLPKHSGAPSADELEAIVDLVARFEGAVSAAALRFWLARDPTAPRVIRDDDGAMIGYSVLLKVEPDDDDARASDPMIGALDSVLDGRAKYSVTRWFGDCNGRHELTSVASGCHILNTERELCTVDEALTWHVLLVSNPESWEPLFRIAVPNDRLRKFEIADHRMTAFTHDMRGDWSLLEWFQTYTREVMNTLKTGGASDLRIARSTPRTRCGSIR